MRFVSVAFSSVLAIGAVLALPARAEPPVPYVEAPAVADDPVRKAIDARLDALEATLRGPQRPWLEAISALYEARDFRPIWLANPMDTKAARAAAGEIARAGDWGLDPAQMRVPDLGTLTREPQRLAEAEVQLSLAALTYVAHARGHRVDPSQLSKWLDQRPKAVSAIDMVQVADAEDPAAALRSLHPKHPQFEKLRQAYLKMRGTSPPASARPIAVPESGPRLKIGSTHADVAILRKRLDVPAGDAAQSQTFDAALADAVRGFQKKAGLKATGVVSDNVRSALNEDSGDRTPRRGAPSEAKKLLVNMERWRWLPDTFANLHVWNNLPEFETRVVKAGRVVHQERIIIGKTDTQTPIFSDRMRYVVFQPDWGIPNSIKITDLLPRLKSGDTGVLDRRGLKVATASGKLMSGSSIDWSRADIREVAIVQPPGASNPLGQVKFMFPNKHDVYMHDTPSKHLFNSSVRTFSHGCIRVRNPRALAELVFAEDRGWGAQQVNALLANQSRPNNKVDLDRSIEVHNTYFTIVANPDGSLRSLPDIYGHDKRIAMALDGTPASVIARSDPAVAQEQRVKAKRQEIMTASARPQPRDEQAYRPVRAPLRGWSPWYGLGFN
jgi:murein L,D-transpeptidase YcbB/YkuD